MRLKALFTKISPPSPLCVGAGAVRHWGRRRAGPGVLDHCQIVTAGAGATNTLSLQIFGGPWWWDDQNILYLKGNCKLLYEPNQLTTQSRHTFGQHSLLLDSALSDSGVLDSDDSLFRQRVSTNSVTSGQEECIHQLTPDYSIILSKQLNTLTVQYYSIPFVLFFYNKIISFSFHFSVSINLSRSLMATIYRKLLCKTK